MRKSKPTSRKVKRKTSGKKVVKTAKKKVVKSAGKKVAKARIKKAVKPARKKLDKKELARYRDTLLKLRASIIESLNHFQKAALYHSQRDASGDLSGYGIHQADSATDAFDIDFSLVLATSNQEIAHDIDEALERIDNGTYGFSELSGKFIGKKRLNAIPYARFTKEEQEQFERNKRAGL